MIDIAKVENGRITARLGVPDDALSREELAEYLLCDPDVGIDSHFLHDGVFQLIPPKPGPAYLFDYISGQWNLDLDLAKEQKWRQLKYRRSAIEFGPFEYNGMVFDGDTDAQRRLAPYISIAKNDPNFTADFILADDSVVELSAEDFIGIELAKTLQVAAAFRIGATLRAQVESAETLEQVNAINWPDLT